MIWKIRSLQEIYLFLGAVFVFALLLMVKIKFKVDPEFADTWFVKALSSQAFEDISSSIFASIVAAYIFYIFIDVIPARNKLREARHALDNILASIVLSYGDKVGSYSSVVLDRHDLKSLNIKNLEVLIAENQDSGSYAGLYSAVLHAQRIQVAMEQGAMLAEKISYRHSMFWVQIMARCNDLAALHSERPQHEILQPDDVLAENKLPWVQTTEGYRDYHHAVVQYKEHMRVRYWILLDDIKYWKLDYSPSRN